MPDNLRENLSFLKTLEKRLMEAGIPVARYEAETLVRHFGRMDRIDFFTGKKGLDAAAQAAALKALEDRLKGRPLAHVLKEAYFDGHTLAVDDRALIPRPETELLVAAAQSLLDARKVKKPEILDLGTGSGCIALSLTIRRPDCRMTASDVSAAALAIARKNIKDKGLGKRIKLVQSDLFARLGSHSWDMIVSNPPYIPEDEIEGLPPEVRREPLLALDGGPEGLKIIRKILAEAPDRLKCGGWLLMEIGKGQSKKLRRIAGDDKSYKYLRFVRDHAGIERILVVERV